MMYRIVEFPSEKAILRGRLYLPEGDAGRKTAVVMAHGFSATISGMGADKFAEAFCAAGFPVLLYDHRNFGLSGGEPRQQIEMWTQARGYRDAITFLRALPGLDAPAIALWGDSFSGAEALLAGAMDERTGAVVVQVPALGEKPPPDDPDGALFAALRETFLHAVLDELPQKVHGPMPVVSADQQSTPSALAEATAYRWFSEYGGRPGTGWENRVTIATKITAVRLNAALCAPHLRAPLLMVIAAADELHGANPEVSRQAFAAAPGPKELLEIDGGHFGLLQYPGRLFDQVSEAQIDFLGRYT
jgi:pimeloyl-ACP methyl ester carboxylesterase